MEHKLKTYPKYFGDIISRKKALEIRKNDRDFSVGDTLVLQEWDNMEYSGRSIIAEVIYIIDDKFIGVASGYVVMGIEVKN